MSITAPEAGQPATSAVDPSTTTDPPEVEEQPTEPTDESKAGREAARYRTQLREAEGQRDTALASLKAARQQLVEGSKTGLQKPDALWAAGVDVDTLFDDDGRMDPEKVKATVAEQIERLGLAQEPFWRRRGLPAPDPTQGVGSHDPGGETDWGQTIRASRGHINP